MVDVIRNYYEILGTFNGIERTAIGPELESVSKKSNKSVQEYCTLVLGYVPITGYTLEETLKIREGYLTKSVEDLPKLFLDRIGISEDFNKKIPANKFKAVSNVKLLKNWDKTLNYKIEDLSLLEKALIKYYLNSNVLVQFNKQPSRLSELINISLKCSLEDRNRIADVMIQGANFKLLTLRNEINRTVAPKGYGATDEISYFEIKNGLLVTPTRVLKSVIEDACKKAIRYCFTGLFNSDECSIKSREDLLTIDKEDSDLYLTLLDYCRTLGITYKDLLEYNKVYVKDIFTLFLQTGMVLKLNDEDAYFDTVNETKLTKGVYELHDIKQRLLLGEVSVSKYQFDTEELENMKAF